MSVGIKKTSLDEPSWRDDPRAVHPREPAHRPASAVAQALLAAWMASQSAPACPVTGIAPLDELLPGLLMPGRLTVLGARPAVGKTALAMQIAGHVAGIDNATDVILVSLEMTAEALARRHVVARAIASGAPLHDPHLWRDERDNGQIADGIVEFGALPYRIIDRDRERWAVGTAILEAVETARKAGRRTGLVIVDYLQQITDRDASTREREVGLASVMLAELAKTAGVAMLVLAQLNRGSATAAEPRPPVVTDLRDSGQIEQDADCVLLLHRPAVVLGQALPGGRPAQIIVGKSRHWGVEPGHTIAMLDTGLRWQPEPVPVQVRPTTPGLRTEAEVGAAVNRWTQSMQQEQEVRHGPDL
jgi:replicative DNA helicase